VASWVFHVIERSRTHPGEQPTFDNLDTEFIDVAASLTTRNVDYEDDLTDDEEDGLVKKDRSSVSVSPAIALVLYGMLDQPSKVAGGATGQAASTPFFSLHEAVLRYISRHHEKG
jgi:hypothetical protein